jgi:hypothetical protein
MSAAERMGMERAWASNPTRVEELRAFIADQYGAQNLELSSTFGQHWYGLWDTGDLTNELGWCYELWPDSMVDLRTDANLRDILNAFGEKP